LLEPFLSTRGTASLSQSQIWIVVVEISRCNAALSGFVGGGN
jgi:hypothetical protein